MKNRKGFTMLEMLIVVAIIAILVAISVSVLSKSLERSREAKDLANIKSAFSEISTALITETPKSELPAYIQVTESGGEITSYYTYVISTQRDAAWQLSGMNDAGDPDADYILVHEAYVPCPTTFKNKVFKLEAFVTPKDPSAQDMQMGYTGPYQYYASVVDKGNKVTYRSTN